MAGLSCPVRERLSYLDGQLRIRGFKEDIDQLAGRNSKPDSVAVGMDNFHVISRDYVNRSHRRHRHRKR